MNITLSADERLVKRAREIARRQGTSLNELVRGYLRRLVSAPSPEETVDELLRSLDEAKARSRGGRFRREDAYEGRV